MVLNLNENEISQTEYNREPIALIGIACEYAGDIHGPKSLWHVLSNTIDVGSVIPKGRCDLDSFMTGCDSDRRVRSGYFLANKVIEEFDPAFFGISDGEALTMDPGHRLLLEKFMHLLDDAGYTVDRVYNSQTAVFIGQFTFDHHAVVYRQGVEHCPAGAYPHLGLYNASARLAYHFGLHGPNVTLDTACSSSLQAVQLAVDALRLGQANLAVAGGVNLCYTPEAYVAASQFPVVCSYINADANGYAKGEGIGLVLLKRLSDAERDGDRIYCVIREVMTNHDGKVNKSAYVVPATYGQTQLLSRIYNASKTDPKSVFYVECHGTGTQIGDPVEANTIGKYFGRSSQDSPLLIGSTKSVLGHTEGASGVTALIKTALCLYKRWITPNMHFNHINPQIKIDEYNLHVVLNMTSLPSSRDNPIIIGINSFGMGGNNCHAIIYDYHMTTNRTALLNGSGTEENHDLMKNPGALNVDQRFVFTLTAKSYTSCRLQVKAILDWLSRQLDTKYEVASSVTFLSCLSKALLTNRTTSFSHRVSFIVANITELHSELQRFYLTSERLSTAKCIVSRQKNEHYSMNPSVCFVFGGQGPQWWAMGRQLYHSEDVFRRWIDRIDSELRLLTTEWNLHDQLLGVEFETNTRINETNIAQPALFAIQIGLAALWISWGIHPVAIIGHSLGEIAAVFVAGRLTLQEAVTVVFHRSRLQHRNTRKNGRMLAVSLSEIEANDLIDGLEDRVNIAAVNSNRSVTLSGDANTLQDVYDVINVLYPKVFRSWIRVENAFHSYQMTRYNIEGDVRQALSKIQGNIVREHEIFDTKCSKARLYSTVIGGQVIRDSCRFDADYWWRNIRQPVLFRQAMDSLLSDFKTEPIRSFIEISPHPVLATALNEILSSHTDVLILPSLKRKYDEQETILSAFVQLARGTADWKQFFESRRYARNLQSNSEIVDCLWDLPCYNFDNSVFWYETKDSVIRRRASRFPYHPLLGTRVWTKPFALWKNMISMENNPSMAYLCDHQVNHEILLPAVGFLEIVVTAARQLQTKVTSIILENVKLIKALILKEDHVVELHTIIIIPSNTFYIYSRSSGKQDVSRLGGLASDDLIASFDDPTILQEYDSREWKLHAEGNIKFTNTVEHNINSDEIYNTCQKLMTHGTWSLVNQEDLSSVYKTLNLRGYQYGTKFQCLRSLWGTVSNLVADVSINFTDTDDVSSYTFHPTLLDACVQTSLVLQPQDHMFVPVSINKITFFMSSIVPSSNEESSRYHCRAYAKLRSDLKREDQSFTADIYILNEHMNSCLVEINGFKLQNISSNHSADISRPSSSIFDKLETISWMPNRSYNDELQILLAEYCVKPIWTLDTTYSSYETTSTLALPTPNTLYDIQMNNIRSVRSSVIDGVTEIDQISAESLPELANWTVNIIKVTLTKLLNISSIDQVDLNELHRIVVSDLHKYVHGLLEVIEEHRNLISITENIDRFSLRQQQVNLLRKYAGLADIITLIGSCADHLLQFLNGQMDPLQWLFGPENEKHLQTYYSLASETLTRIPLEALLNYLQSSNLDDHVLKVLELGAGTGGSTVHMLDLLLDYVNNNNARVEYVFTDISPSFFASARLRLAPLLERKNQKNRLSITYQVINLDRSPNWLLIESFHVVFASNVVHATQNVVRSLDHIRQYLIPGGLTLLVEIGVSIPYLDLIFGLLPQWWIDTQTNDNVRHGQSKAIIDIKKWEKAFSLAGGYTHFDACLSKTGLCTLATQKSIKTDDFSNLPENQQRVWVIFSDHTHKIACDFVKALKDKYYDNLNIIFVVRKSNPECREHNSSIFFVNDASIDIHILFQQLGQKYKFLQIVFLWPLDLYLSILSETDSNHQIEDNVFYKEQEQLCLVLLQIIQVTQHYMHNNHRIYVLTSNSQRTVPNSHHNPFQAPVIGFVRSLLHEYTHGHIRLFDLQPLTDKASRLSFSTLLKHVVNEIISNEISSDNEIVLMETPNGCIQRYKLRYAPIIHQLNGYRLLDTPMFYSTRPILITGGLGRIGLALARWMIEKREVKHVFLLARQSTEEIDEQSTRGRKWKALLHIAEDHAASVNLIKGDVASYEDVHRVIAHINSTGSILRGIVHGALVLRDSLVSNMSANMLTSVMQPRIRGAWNLHRASMELQPKGALEFFVLLSSLRNHVIDMGGANYNATNEFFDSLAYWRRNTLREPGLSISVPLVRSLNSQGKDETEPLSRLHFALKGIPNEVLFELIEHFHDQQQQQQDNPAITPIIFAVDWRAIKEELDYSKTGRIRELVDMKNNILAQQADKRTNVIENEVNKNTDLKMEDVIHEVVTKIFGSTNSERIDKDKALFEQGLDSLMAVALHNWLGARYAVFLPVFDIIQGMSVNNVVEAVKMKQSDEHQIKSVSGTSNTSNEKTTTRSADNTIVSTAEKQLPHVSYHGTSLVEYFPKHTELKVNCPLIFYVPSVTTTDHTEQDNRFAESLKLRLKSISHLCIFQRADNVTDIAHEYIMQMRRIQPRGPYHLIGYKTGALIAYEMCLRLDKHFYDARVQNLLLIHPPSPEQFQLHQSSDSDFRKSSKLSTNFVKKSTDKCKAIIIDSEDDKKKWVQYTQVVSIPLMNYKVYNKNNLVDKAIDDICDILEIR